MSDALTITQYDFKNARRSRLLWAVIVIYIGFMAIVVFPSSEDLTVTYSLLGATWISGLVLPLVAIAGAYLSIAGERESNTIRFLLSQPTGRSSVVVGKFVSRSLVLTLGFLLAAIVSAGIVYTSYDSPKPGQLGVFLGLSGLLIGAYTAIAVAISAAVASRARAVAITISFYFVTVVLPVFPGLSIEGILRELGDALGLGIEDGLYTLFASMLAPGAAYMNAIFRAFPADATDISAEGPAYLDPSVLVGILVLWIVLPIGLGVVVFNRLEIE